MKKLLLLAVLAFGSLGLSSQTITRLIGASPFQDSLWVIDTANYSIVRRLAPTPSSGGTITGTTALAAHPVTGQVFTVQKQSSTSGRTLGTLNPLTAVVTIIGNLGDNFSSITFNGNNTLLGVTGDGATTPETVYRIDQTNATKTLLRTLGAGADGEVICYNPGDNMVYHWSGNGTVVYEKFDTSGVTVTGIPIIGSTNGETFGAVSIGGNKFLTSNISASFNRFNTAGNVTPPFGSNPDDLRGLAFIHCDRSITGTPSFCEGDSTLLTFGQAVASSYQWFRNGVAIPGATSQTHIATQGGHYNVWVADACSNGDSSGVGINVVENPLPNNVAVSDAGDTLLCPGDTLMLVGTPPGTNQWTLNGANISGANTTLLSVSAPGVYNMFFTDANGCTDSAAVGVIITSVPNPVVTLAADTVQCGGSVLLDAGNPGASYFWNDGSTTQTINASSTGNYFVEVTDSNGCSASDSVNVTINPLPLVDLGADTSACGSLVLDAMNPGATYLWSDSSVTQTITVNSSGPYSVMVLDSNGCSNSDTVSVTINPMPSVFLNVSQPTLCQGDSTVIVASGGNAVQWYFNGQPIPGATGNSIFASQPGVYNVILDLNGCQDSAAVGATISVSSLPTVVSSASSNFVCVTDANVTLFGSPAGGTHSGPGVTGTSFSPSSAGVGTHNVIYMYTDSNGCSASDTSVIVVSACVGIMEHAAGSIVNVFPNPGNGSFTLTLEENANVRVLDALGRMVFAARLNKGQHAFDLQHLPAGMYLLQAEAETHSSALRLVITR